MTVTFALLPGRVGCNLGLVYDEHGPGLLVTWCAEEMLTGAVIRRGDGTLADKVWDEIARVTR